MPGETDLATILATLRIERRPDPVTVVELQEPVPVVDGVIAVIDEGVSTTVIATLETARQRGWTPGFVAAWLTVSIQTSLEAVGLTARLATALTERSIPCNVVAGARHDHILVPWDRADDAVEILEGLGDA